MGIRRPIEAVTAPNQRWSLDFVSDQMTDGRRFRILCVVDDYTRECLTLVADTSLSGTRVARELDAIIQHRGRPAMIVSDNVLCSEGIRATGQKISVRDFDLAI
jgi:transposase InsO family protein